jgi:triacylglycerol lipase
MNKLLRLGLLACSLVALGACAADTDDEAEDPMGGGKSEDQLIGISAPLFGPEPQGSPAKHPIVLHHGFAASNQDGTNGSKKSIWAFNGVERALEQDRHVVYSSNVAPFQPTAVRAQQLFLEIERAKAECRTRAGCDASKVHVIAHSYGGLDVREYIRQHPKDHSILSLTTISTPHQGTYIADLALKYIRTFKDTNALADDLMVMAINALAAIYGNTFTDMKLAVRADVIGALTDLSEANAPKFNLEHPDAPGVVYQTWAGVSGSQLGVRANPRDITDCENKFPSYRQRRDFTDKILWAPATVVGHFWDAIPNDGIATVVSAKWDSKKFQGCIPADHLDEVGQPDHDGPNRWTGFDHLRFYRNVAFGLAKLEGDRTR